MNTLTTLHNRLIHIDTLRHNARQYAPNSRYYWKLHDMRNRVQDQISAAYLHQIIASR